jgi:hypothetical protein
MSVAFERRSRPLCESLEPPVMRVREEDRPMKLCVLSLRWPVLIAAVLVMVMLMPASGIAKKPPGGGGGGSGGF